MTGKAEGDRKNKPDAANPRIVNGSFEEEPNYKAEGGQPGWYYERLVNRRTDEKSPDGMHYLEFKNSEPNLDGHLLQGFPIDGRKIGRASCRERVESWVVDGA